jgi:phosphotransferase system  glucose/maltose/N-acetylglucosamine-specific IIC component
MFIQTSNPFAENQIFGDPFEGSMSYGSNSSSGFPIWKIILGVAVFILGGFIIVYFYNRNQKKKAETAAIEEEKKKQTEIVVVNVS